MITGDCTVTGTFALNTYALNVNISGKGTGLVTSSPAGISCPADCTEILAHGSSLILAAEPAKGSSFKGWSGDCSGQETSCIITVDRAKDVQAEFHYFPWSMFQPAMQGKENH